MDNTLTNIEILIGKSVSGNASTSEISQIEAWVAESKTNQQIYSASLKAWKTSNSWISNEKISSDKNLVQQSINKTLSVQVRKIKKQSLIYKIAAIIAIPLALALSLYITNNKKQVEQIATFCEITAPKGHVSKCILPDGTEVWINTGSTITYNTSAFNGLSRDVNLVGEAFFKVTKNKKAPFKVITSQMDIKVTGTSFNVKAYPESKIFETVLTEGSIEMQIKLNGQQNLNMEPGERAVYDLENKKIMVNDVDTELFTSWRNGEIIFKDATLNDLISELERIYDIKFHLKDTKLGLYRFRGMFSYNNNLIDALENIKKTAQLDYYIENKEVWLSKN